MHNTISDHCLGPSPGPPTWKNRTALCVVTSATYGSRVRWDAVRL